MTAMTVGLIPFGNNGHYYNLSKYG